MAKSDGAGYGRLFRKMFKYGGAKGNATFDAKADPEIQMQQAIDDSRQRHAALTEQAAKVIGSEHQLAMKLSRQTEEVANMQANAKGALGLADKARAAGDEAKAQQYEASAQTFATQLINGEASLTDLKNLHDQSLVAADSARKAVEQNATKLQGIMAEKTKLMTQLQSAKMQEQVAAQLSSVNSLAAPSDVPTLDDVREKIEARYANALGASDLASHSVEGQLLEVQQATVDAKAQDRLAELRASMAPKALG